MPRHPYLLLLLPFLAACQTPVSRPATASTPDASSPSTFNQDTVQTYDIQTGQFQQQPPFGARSNRSQ